MRRSKARLFSEQTRWPWHWLGALLLLLVLMGLPMPVRDTALRTPLGPVATGIQKPAQWVLSAREYFQLRRASVTQLQQQVTALSQENAQLRRLETQYQQLKKSYDALWPDDAQRQALDKPLYLASVKQLSAWQQPHQLTLSINQPLSEGMGVIGPRGVVGLIQSVSEHTANVLLITDARLGIPVKNQRTGYRSLASGDGQFGLKVTHVPEGIDIQQDDLWVSSGEANRFPVDVPVAKTTQVMLNPKSPFLNIQAEPVESLHTLQWGWVVYE